MDIIELSQMLGNFGEFVGAIAVVATLAYLAIQVRQSRREAAANVLQQRNEHVLTVYGAVTTSDSLADALSKAQTHYGVGDRGTDAIRHFLEAEVGLSAKEAVQLSMYYGLIWSIYVTNHKVSDPAQRAINDQRIRSQLSSNIGRRTWGAMRLVAPTDFAQHVDSLDSRSSQETTQQ